MDKEYILEKLRENRQYFEEHQVNKIGVFGSYARGEATEESDIDILVEMNVTKDIYFNMSYVRYFLEDLFGKNIDLVRKTEEEPIYKVKSVKEHFEKVRKDILDSVIYA